MDIIIILRLIFKPYTKKQKGPVKKYDSRKYIHVHTVDFRPRQELSRPRKYCNKKSGSYECFIYNTEAVFEIIVAIIINSNISWQVALINTYA